MTADRSYLNGLNCVVLGGGGFIGTHLCRALKQHGAAVRGFGRTRAHPEILASIPWINGEFGDTTVISRVVEGSELVFHLLGGSTPDSSNHDPLGDLLGSTAPTLRLLDICRESMVRKIVFISSGGTVYGIPGQIPIPESAPTNPISAYGISKLAIEKYLALYRHLHGLDFSILRVANPFGPLQDPDRRQGLVAALMHRVVQSQPLEIWGDGLVVRDFIYIDDVIDAILDVVPYRGPYHVFNVGAGTGRSVLQVADDVAQVLGRPDTTHIHKPGRAADVPVNILDISLIAHELGWVPRTQWTHALQRTADWMRTAANTRSL